jgi:hypothetical protein
MERTAESLSVSWSADLRPEDRVMARPPGRGLGHVSKLGWRLEELESRASLCSPEGFETTFRVLSANRIPSAGEATVRRRTLRTVWRVPVPHAARSLGDVRNDPRRVSITATTRCGVRHLFPVAIAAVVHCRGETPGKTQHRRAGIEPDLSNNFFPETARTSCSPQEIREVRRRTRERSEYPDMMDRDPM